MNEISGVNFGLYYVCLLSWTMQVHV